MSDFEVIIVGSGIAALTAAYQLSFEKNVIVITKSKETKSNSMLAQGGVAASMSDHDTWYSHFKDTMTAGCEHNLEEAVEVLVKKGPSYLLSLMRDGMKFDVDQAGNLLLGKEGAHSTRRILHAGGDATGRALTIHMLDKVKDSVQIVEDEMAIDLILSNSRCIGVETKSANGTEKDYYAPTVILATGGCGGLYSFTSNEESITGDGIAIAYRAGATLTDLEFIQFHPTLLHVNGNGVGLISEAVRGEGGILVTGDGRQIMIGIHPLKDLAPRDVVARAIYQEMIAGNKVYLDISMLHDFETHFPTISENCKRNGIKIENGLIPVIPGAHFLMGGIKTDGHGRTSIDGLYAIGEVACTGVHGANRLASNSLLEGIVFGNLVADDISKRSTKPVHFQKEEKNVEMLNLELPTKKEIQGMMVENVGIVREKEKLQNAADWFEGYINKFDGYSLSRFNKEQLVLINMITAGWLITTSALMRTESRGAHYRTDFPVADNQGWYKREIYRTSKKEKVLHSI